MQQSWRQLHNAIIFGIGFFTGGFVGAVLMSVVAAGAYDKGREDERRIYRRD